MTVKPDAGVSGAGQISWTRDLARDLFPGRTTPFGWTLLRAPAEAALQRTWAGLGVADLPAERWWRLAEDGLVYLNGDQLVVMARALHGAAWLGPVTGEEPRGLAARLRAGNIMRRAEAEVSAVAAGAAAMQARLLDWLDWVRGLRWSQAELLQVMEELEPQAQAALHNYFTIRAGLEAAGARLEYLLGEAAPGRPIGSLGALFAGLPGLPSVEAVYALGETGAAGAEAFLARYGHRGAGDVRPDALRWRENPAALTFAVSQTHSRRRTGAGRPLLEAVDAGKRRQVEPAVERAHALARAADLAWEGVILVMAAAQDWLAAAAREAKHFGLIGDVGDAPLLELEELKQVATGEWHGGRRETVRAEVERRRGEGVAATPPLAPDHPLPVSPGTARGPALPLTDGTLGAPQPGAILVAPRADAGWTDQWLYAAGLAVGATELWSPGMLVARVLGLPAVAGAGALVEQARTGDTVVVDGEAGRAGFA